MWLIIILLIITDLVFAIFFWIYGTGCERLDEEIKMLKSRLDYYHYTGPQIEIKLDKMRIEADNKYVKKENKENYLFD